MRKALTLAGGALSALHGSFQDTEGHRPIAYLADAQRIFQGHKRESTYSPLTALRWMRVFGRLMPRDQMDRDPNREDLIAAETAESPNKEIPYCQAEELSGPVVGALSPFRSPCWIRKITPTAPPAAAPRETNGLSRSVGAPAEPPPW